MTPDTPATPGLISNPIAPIGGTEVDDEGRLASDLPCWTCEYNLRSLELDAACPECGTPVAYTLEHSDGRKNRPFSLHTINPVSRTVGLLFGMIGPAMIVLFAATNPMDPINVEWQSGEIEEIVGVMLSGQAMLAFYPFLLWAYIAFGALMVGPVAMGRQWWVKAGLWLGCILGLQYQLIVNLNLFGLAEQFWIALVIGLIPLGVLGGIVATYTIADAKRSARARDKRSWRSAWIQFGVTFSVIVLASFTTGVPFFIVLVAGPYMMLLCMSAALCRLYRTDFEPPAERFKPIPAAVTVGSYAAAWPIAITQAQVVYSSLPMTDPSCYICTASAHGHPWLTRAKPVKFANGQVMLVTRQMQTLKAAEQLIAERAPKLHQLMRLIYDTIGPRIAIRIHNQWLANASYLLFAPIAAIAWLSLRLLGRSKDIDRAYRG